MSSPGQKKGNCGHTMAGFDGHSFCARCREKGKGEEPCIANKDTTDCKFCNLFTPEQRAQISTPSYKIKKEKQEAKRVDNPTPTEDIALVDPVNVSVIGAVGGPVANVSKDSEPFFQPPHRPVDSGSQRTDPDTDAAMQPSAGKLPPDTGSQGP